MKRSSLLLSTCLITGFIAPAFAANQDTPVIVVSPTRSQTPIDQIASSVTVIDSQEIARQNKSSVTELLSDVPGLSIVNSGGAGQSTRLFMRGTNSNHVLVMIDGVVVNDPSDPATAYDFSNLPTDNIERIEVLRGPQSTIYGSQAIGGVISIYTKQGKGAPHTDAFAEYGRYNSRKEGVSNSGEIGRTSYSLSASEAHTDGFSSFDKRYGGKEKDGNNNYNLSGNIASKLTDNFTAKLNLRYNQSATEFDSVGSLGIGGTRPDDDPLPHGIARQLNARAAGELSLLDGQWKQELGISTLYFNRDAVSEYFDSFYTPHFGSQQYLGQRNTIDWVHHLTMIENHAITLGTEISSDSLKENSPVNGFATVNVDNKAVYADDQFTLGDVFLNYGVREDDHQAFGRQFTWKVAPGYNIKATDTILKASYGTGFKAPSLSQLFDRSSGNPDLGPERSKGWDAGFEQKLLGKRLTFGSTYFRNDITDLIGFGPAPLYATINVGKARTQGFESNVKFFPLPQLSLSASHTYTLSDDRSHDKWLLRRPKHVANFDSVYQYSDSGDIGLNVHYITDSRDYDYPTSSVVKDIKGYSTVNLTTNYKVNQTWGVYGRLDNLLNKHYELIDGYGEPGMGLYAGVKASY